MNFIKIPKKKKGEFRRIAMPSNEEKKIFREFLPKLNEKCKKMCSDNAHGFIQNKSPQTNAIAHINKKFTLSFDLSDFFDTIKPHHLEKKLSKEEIAILMPDSCAYQGLPTSPQVSNLAAIELDRAINKCLNEKDIIYTRYADDLTFSFDNYDNVSFLKEHIPNIVGRCGFKLNKSKTRLQDSKFGNRVITGVSVNNNISASRNIRRKLRASIHQNNSKSKKGLEEWVKMKLPKPKESSKYSQQEINTLCDFWQIKKVCIAHVPNKTDTLLETNVLITGDLVHLLGISNFTTNWRSCMHHPSGCNHKKVLAWSYLEGTRVAGYFSEESIKVCGFERKKMKARALVHKLRNGVEYYDRIYGESPESIEFLKNSLECNNIKSIHAAPNNTKVMGNVPCNMVYGTPYLDSLTYSKGKSTVGRYAGKLVYILKTR